MIPELIATVKLLELMLTAMVSNESIPLLELAFDVKLKLEPKTETLPLVCALGVKFPVADISNVEKFSLKEYADEVEVETIMLLADAMLA